MRIITEMINAADVYFTIYHVTIRVTRNATFTVSGIERWAGLRYPVIWLTDIISLLGHHGLISLSSRIT